MSTARAIIMTCLITASGAMLSGCQTGQTMGASASTSGAATTSTSTGTSPSLTTLRADDDICRRFRALRGGDRIAEGRAIYEQALPQPVVLGRGVSGLVCDPARRTFELSSTALIDALGEPDAQTPELLTYELGTRHGRRHVLQIAVSDGRVGASNLGVWF